MTAFIVYLVAYWMMALQGSFVLYVLVYWASGLAAASTALLVGCLAANPEVANQAGPAIFVPQLLFAGFYIPVSQIPVWLRWVQYISSLKYAMNLFMYASLRSHRTRRSQANDLRTVPTTGLRRIAEPLTCVPCTTDAVWCGLQDRRVWELYDSLLVAVAASRGSRHPLK